MRDEPARYHKPSSHRCSLCSSSGWGGRTWAMRRRCIGVWWCRVGRGVGYEGSSILRPSRTIPGSLSLLVKNASVVRVQSHSPDYRVSIVLNWETVFVRRLVETTRVCSGWVVTKTTVSHQCLGYGTSFTFGGVLNVLYRLDCVNWNDIRLRWRTDMPAGSIHNRRRCRLEDTTSGQRSVPGLTVVGQLRGFNTHPCQCCDSASSLFRVASSCTAVMVRNKNQEREDKKSARPGAANMILPFKAGNTHTSDRNR